MTKLTFLRHYETKPDKDKPAPEWDLSEKGKEATLELLDSEKLRNIDKIFASTEKKAAITAMEVAKKYKVPFVSCEELVEVDRSRSGFIEGDYGKVVEQYLSCSKEFRYNWEKVSHVKERIEGFLGKICAEPGNLLIVSHGLFLSILLAGYLNRKPFDFWKELKFGQILEVDFERLKTYVAKHG